MGQDLRKKDLGKEKTKKERGFFNKSFFLSVLGVLLSCLIYSRHSRNCLMFI